jgi:hypothetical protein
MDQKSSYNSKLLTAAKEIQTVLAKHDVGGVFIIHTPGNVQFGVNVSPSYSAAFMKGDQFTINDSLVLNNGGDQKAQDKKLIDTFNMVVNFRVMCQNLSKHFLKTEFAFAQKIKHLLPKSKNPPPNSNGRIIT